MPAGRAGSPDGDAPGPGQPPGKETQGRGALAKVGPPRAPSRGRDPTPPHPRPHLKAHLRGLRPTSPRGPTGHRGGGEGKEGHTPPLHPPAGDASRRPGPPSAGAAAPPQPCCSARRTAAPTAPRLGPAAPVPALTPAAPGAAQQLLLLRVPYEFLPVAVAVLGLPAGHGEGAGGRAAARSLALGGRRGQAPAGLRAPRHRGSLAAGTRPRCGAAGGAGPGGARV